MIYIDVKKEDTFQQFLKNCLIIPEDRNSFRQNYYFKETFYDKKLSVTQCAEVSSRSLRDITYLIQNYYPEVTEDDIIKTLFEGIDDVMFMAAFCVNVDRLVFWGKNKTQDIIEFYIHGYAQENPWEYVEDDETMEDDEGVSFDSLKNHYLTKIKNKKNVWNK